MVPCLQRRRRIPCRDDAGGPSEGWPRRTREKVVLIQWEKGELTLAHALLSPNSRSRSFLPSRSNRFSTNAPVVGFNLIDHYDRCLWILPKDIHQELRHSIDELGFLIGCGTLFGDLDVHVGHGNSSIALWSMTL